MAQARANNIRKDIADSLRDFLSRKVNAQNAFDTPFIESIKDVIDVEPLQCVGQMLDAGSKIYGYRVDNTHNECYSVLLATGQGSKNAKKNVLNDENEDENEHGGEENEDEDPMGEGEGANEKQKGKKKHNIQKLIDGEEREGKMLKRAHQLAKKFPDLHKIVEGVPTMEEICGAVEDFRSKMRQEYRDSRIGMPYVVDASKVKAKLNRSEFDHRIEEPIYRKVSKGFSEGCTINFVHIGALKNDDGNFMILHTNWPNKEPEQAVQLQSNHVLSQRTPDLICDQLERSFERALCEKPSNLPILEYCCEFDEEITGVKDTQQQQNTSSQQPNVDEDNNETLTVEQNPPTQKSREEIFKEIGFSGDELLPVQESQPATAFTLASTANQSTSTNKFYMVTRFAPYIDSIWHAVIKKALQTELTAAGIVNIGRRSLSSRANSIATSSQIRPSSMRQRMLGTPSGTPGFVTPAIPSTSKKGSTTAKKRRIQPPTKTPTPLLATAARKGFGTPYSDQEHFIYFWARPREYPMVYLGQSIKGNPMTNKIELLESGDLDIENVLHKNPTEPLECALTQQTLDRQTDDNFDMPFPQPDFSLETNTATGSTLDTLSGATSSFQKSPHNEFNDHEFDDNHNDIALSAPDSDSGSVILLNGDHMNIGSRSAIKNRRNSVFSDGVEDVTLTNGDAEIVPVTTNKSNAVQSDDEIMEVTFVKNKDRRLNDDLAEEFDNGDIIEDNDFGQQEAENQDEIQILNAIGANNATHEDNVEGGIEDLAVPQVQLRELVQTEQDMVTINEPLVEDNTHWRGKDVQPHEAPKAKSKRGKKKNEKTSEDLGLIPRKRKRFVPPLYDAQGTVEGMHWELATPAQLLQNEEVLSGPRRSNNFARDRQFLQASHSQIPSPLVSKAATYNPMELLRMRSFEKGKFCFLACAHGPAGSRTRFVENREDLSQIAPNLDHQMQRFLDAWSTLGREQPHASNQNNFFNDAGDTFDVGEVDPDFALNLSASDALPQNQRSWATGGLNLDMEQYEQSDDDRDEVEDEEEEEQMKFFGGIMNLRQIKIKAPQVKRAAINILTSDELGNDALQQAQKDYTDNSIAFDGDFASADNASEISSDEDGDSNDSSSEDDALAEDGGAEPMAVIPEKGKRRSQGVTFGGVMRNPPLSVNGVHTNRDLLAFLPEYLYGQTKRDLNVINAFAITLHLCNEKGLILMQEKDPKTGLTTNEGMTNFVITSSASAMHREEEDDED